MDNEIVPYEQALELKKVGFEYISTIFAYDQSGELYTRDGIPHDFNIRGLLSAPTFSQAFRWFREKYNVEHNNRPVKKFETDKSREISFYIDGYFISNLRFTTDKTYEEAELECLKKLIKLYKK